MVLDSLSTEAENSIHKQSLYLDLKERNGGTVSLVVCGNSTHVNEGSVSGKSSDTSDGTLQRAGKRQGDATLEDMYNNQYSDNDDDNDSDWEPLSKPLQTLKWFCVNCTMVNFDNAFHCDVCGEHRESGILKLGYFASPLFPEGVEKSSSAILETKGAQYQNVSTLVGFDERMLLHKEVEMKSHPHPERPDRIRAIAAAFATAGIFPGRCASMPAREITREELQMIHSSENIDAVELTSQMVSSYFTPDTYATEHSALAARLAAGVCADLASAIFAGRAKNGFALVRPPGHHAGVKSPSGFCLHNNAAVAASAAQLSGAKKVLIVDWDVHHGNGTQEIFDGSKSVLYISLHRHEHGRFYPGTGAADKVGSMGAEGYCVNIPWSCRGVGDNDYIYAFQQVVIPIASEFAPDFTIISAGFDAARGDPLGCCDVTPAGFAQMTEMLSALSGGKLLVILEGGYNLRSISSSATAVIKVLLGEDPGCNSEELVPSRSGLRTICKVLKIQMKFWHILEPILSKLQSRWGAYAVEHTAYRSEIVSFRDRWAAARSARAEDLSKKDPLQWELPMVDMVPSVGGAEGLAGPGAERSHKRKHPPGSGIPGPVRKRGMSKEKPSGSGAVAAGGPEALSGRLPSGGSSCPDPSSHGYSGRKYVWLPKPVTIDMSPEDMKEYGTDLKDVPPPAHFSLIQSSDAVTKIGEALATRITGEPAPLADVSPEDVLDNVRRRTALMMSENFGDLLAVTKHLQKERLSVKERDKLRSKLGAARANESKLQDEVESLKDEVERLSSERDQFKAEKDALETEKALQAQKANEGLRASKVKIRAAENAAKKLRVELEKAQTEVERVTGECDAQFIDGLVHAFRALKVRLPTLCPDDQQLVEILGMDLFDERIVALHPVAPFRPTEIERYKDILQNLPEPLLDNFRVKVTAELEKGLGVDPGNA